MNFLKPLDALLRELDKTNSSSEKLEILKRHPGAKDALLATYHPYKNYFVTSEKCREHGKIDYEHELPPFEGMLSLLCERRVTGHAAMEMVNAVANATDPQLHRAFWAVLDRDLNVGVGATAINKVFPGLIPEFKVALANKYDEKTAKKVKFDGSFVVSRKLDGLRLITVVEGGEAKCYSRLGNEIPQAARIAEDAVKACEAAGVESMVLDGELCVLDKDGNEDFQEAVGAAHRKNTVIENPKYYVFDAIRTTDFRKAKGNQTLAERYKALEKIVSAAEKLGLKSITRLPQTPATSEQVFSEAVAEASAKGWEGVMLRNLKAVYEGKRTNDLLKVKKFCDAEYVVVDAEMGPIRVIDPVTKLASDEVMLSNVTIVHKGAEVDVGSGFSLEQRRAFFKDPKAIIGKQITVKYFEETVDQNGKPSLRFPVIKKVWEKGIRDL